MHSSGVIAEPSHLPSIDYYMFVFGHVTISDVLIQTNLNT